MIDNTEDPLFKSSCVLVLQRVVVMFIKSKQQIIREQLQLKAKKQSSSLRQTLNKVASKKNQKASKIQDQNDELVSTFRKSITDPSHVALFLSNVFANPVNASCLLNKLHGKELCNILQSLGLPGLNGKSKQRQVDLFIKHHSDGKVWNILFPDKVCWSETRLICYTQHNVSVILGGTFTFCDLLGTIRILAPENTDLKMQTESVCSLYCILPGYEPCPTDCSM